MQISSVLTGSRAKCVHKCAFSIAIAQDCVTMQQCVNRICRCVVILEVCTPFEEAGLSLTMFSLPTWPFKCVQMRAGLYSLTLRLLPIVSHSLPTDVLHLSSLIGRSQSFTAKLGNTLAVLVVSTDLLVASEKSVTPNMFDKRIWQVRLQTRYFYGLKTL